jgi:hypothetical protein
VLHWLIAHEQCQNPGSLQAVSPHLKELLSAIDGQRTLREQDRPMTAAAWLERK